MMKTVLVVDDSLSMRILMKTALKKVGYEVVGEAETGESGIDKALDLNPDLIILDNILPDMIGVDFIKTLKAKVSVESKIILISSVGQESELGEGMKIGTEDCIVKPFTSGQLINSLDKILNGIEV